MRYSLAVAAALAALLISAPASGQEARSNANSFSYLTHVCCDAGEATDRAVTPGVLVDAEGDSNSRYIFWGGVAGAFAGGIWGYALDAGVEDRNAGSAMLLTIPLGILIGALTGAAVGALTN